MPSVPLPFGSMIEVAGEVFYSPHQLDGVLRFTPGTVLKACEDGELKCARINGTYVISATSLRAWLEGKNYAGQ